MNIIKQTSTHNTTYSPGRSIKYIAIHYTAGTTSRTGSARNTANYFRTTKNEASADFVVDDSEIVQYNPDPRNRYCWAVGGRKWATTNGGRLYKIAKNSNVVSIEICSTKSGNTYTFTSAVVDRAVELTRYLMQTYGIDINHVIRHYDVTGKTCPNISGWIPEAGGESEWNKFRARLMGQETTKTTEYEAPKGIRPLEDYGVFRCYNPNSGAHFFTANPDEVYSVTKAGWRYEGIAWHWGGDQNVYRLYNPNNGDHLYTTSVAEREAISREGWHDEGAVFRAGVGVPVYRLYNPNQGQHMYTVSAQEKANLVKAGWKYEDVAFCENR